ncbi:MAG: transposase [Xanthomonadales bacterium]|nr:transposase [Xanthomonadales bacterium]
MQAKGERLSEAIKCRTRVVRSFPNETRCPRLIRASCGETDETW